MNELLTERQCTQKDRFLVVVHFRLRGYVDTQMVALKLHAIS